MTTLEHFSEQVINIYDLLGEEEDLLECEENSNMIMKGLKDSLGDNQDEESLKIIEQIKRCEKLLNSKIRTVNPDVILELYNIYLLDKKECIDRLIESFIDDDNQFNTYLSEDFDFLNTFLPNVKQAIISLIKEDHIDYFDAIKSFDFDIDELNEFVKISIYPPYPLVGRCDNNKQKFLTLCNQNNYKPLNGNKKLINDVLSGKKKGDVKVTFLSLNLEKEIYLHSHILDEHEFFNRGDIIIDIPEIVTDNVVVTGDVVVIDEFCRFLYTGSFDILSTEQIKILCIMANNCSLTGLTQMCTLILPEEY